MIVFSSSRRASVFFSSVFLQRVSAAIVKVLRIQKKQEIFLDTVSPKKIQELNRSYRNQNHATDVLSFPILPLPLPLSKRERQFAGEIILCPTYAKKQAHRRGIKLDEELLRLLIHGVLHLEGYDHDTKTQEMKMFRLQERILERVLSPTPL